MSLIGIKAFRNTVQSCPASRPRLLSRWSGTLMMRRSTSPTSPALIVYLLYTLLCQQAQGGIHCLWVSVAVGAQPEAMGWRLVSNTQQKNLLLKGVEVLPGGYTKEMVAANNGNPELCQILKIPTGVSNTGLSLQLFHVDGRAWEDRGVMLSFTDEDCQNIQTFNGRPIEAYKDAAGPVTVKLPPMTFSTNCGTTVGGQSSRADATSDLVVNAPSSKGCPPIPTLDAAQGLGPDMVAVNEGWQKLSIVRSCFSTKPVKYNSRDPWNEKYQAYCDAVEGKIDNGCHLALRFRAGLANIGTTDLHLGDPFSQFQAGSPLWEWGNCHRHWHWKGFAMYELIDSVSRRVFLSKKVGFCAEDTANMPGSLNMGTYQGKQGIDYRGKKARFTRCGTGNRTACQGISTGKMDVYSETLAGQFFCLTGCAGGNIPFGRKYILRITANPPYSPNSGIPCPFKDPAGNCRRLFELNYDNNIGDLQFTLTTKMVPSKYRYLVNG